MPPPPARVVRSSATWWRTATYWAFYRIPKRWRRRIVRIATPTYTLGAVMLVYSTDGDRLLMLRQPPGRGWTLPAGLLQRAEQPWQGGLRELREETGIALTIDDITPAVPNAVVHTSGRWVDTVFVARLDPDTTQLRVDGAEVWDAQWHPVDDLPQITNATARLLAHYDLGPLAGAQDATVDQT